MPAPKPTFEHERDGTLRKDRHGDRADGLYPKGPPATPDGLDGHQRWMWNLVVENVPGAVICPGDAAELLVTCSWWSLWREIHDELVNEKSPQQRTHLMNQLSMASKRVAEGLKRFGMSPAARTLLKVAGGRSKKSSPVEALMNLRAKQLAPSKS